MFLIRAVDPCSSFHTPSHGWVYDKVGRHADHHEDDAADHDVHAGTATEEIAHHRHNVAAQEDAGALNARQK